MDASRSPACSADSSVSLMPVRSSKKTSVRRSSFRASNHCPARGSLRRGEAATRNCRSGAPTTRALPARPLRAGNRLLRRIPRRLAAPDEGGSRGRTRPACQHPCERDAGAATEHCRRGSALLMPSLSLVQLAVGPARCHSDSGSIGPCGGCLRPATRSASAQAPGEPAGNVLQVADWPWLRRTQIPPQVSDILRVV